MGKSRKNKAKGLLWFLILLLSALGLLVGAAWVQSMTAEKEALQKELDKYRMELTLHRMTEMQRAAIEEAEAEQKANEEAKRLSLKDAFLARNREELLTLVNPWHELSEAYEPHLTEIGDGMLFDERAAGALKHMLEDAKAEGIIAVPISGYRTREYQQGLFDDKVLRVRANGFEGEEALTEAAKEVAVPGTSEHELGLAMDILDVNNPNLDWTQEWAPAQRWLMEHCVDYGFILRFPNGTTEKTGIIYEPWHYRYVGLSAAEEITASGLTLEEYLEKQ
jgi:LAS superfamily LD-carboxypeptidase LdcB